MEDQSSDSDFEEPEQEAEDQIDEHKEPPRRSGRKRPQQPNVRNNASKRPQHGRSERREEKR
jgi:hypothetical protein